MRKLRSWLSVYVTVLFAGLMAACSTAPQVMHGGYSGPEVADPSQAILISEAGDVVHIDGKEAGEYGHGAFKLTPGPHVIDWTHTFLVSVLVDSRMRVPVTSGPAKLTLDSGHLYRLRSDRTYGHGSRMYLWIEEANSGYVLWSSKYGAAFRVRDRNIEYAPPGFVEGTRLLGEAKGDFEREEIVHPVTDWSGLSTWRATLLSAGYSDADIVDGSEVAFGTYCYNLEGESQSNCRHNGYYIVHVSPALQGALTFSFGFHHAWARDRGDLVEVEFHATTGGRLVGTVVAVYRKYSNWGLCKWTQQDVKKLASFSAPPFGISLECDGLEAQGWIKRHVAGSPPPPADSPGMDVHEWIKLPTGRATNSRAPAEPRPPPAQ